MPLGTSPPRLALGQVEIAPESTFGTAGTYKYIEIVNQPDVSGTHRLSSPNESLRGTVDPQHVNIMAPSGVCDANGTFQTSHYLQGFLGTIPSAADILAAVNASTGYPLAWVLKAALGGQAYGGTGTEDGASSSTVSSIVLGDLDASLIDAGHVFGIQTASGYEAGFASVADMVTETITPRLNFEAAPSNTSTVWGGITSYAAASLADSYSLRWTGWLESSTTPLRFVATGCVPASIELTLNARDIPRVNVTWRYATFTWSSGISPGSAYNAWAYGAAGNVNVPAPEYVVARRFVYYTAADTYVDLDTPTFSVTLDNDLQVFPDPNGPGGIKTFRRGPNYGVRCTVRIPYAGETWWESQTEIGIQAVHGSQPGKMIAISIPRAHVVEPPSGPSDESGYAYVTYVLRALRYTSDTQPAGGQAADNRILAIGLV